MKRIVLAGAVLALALPGTADAGQHVNAKKLAKQACKAERDASKAAFKAEYGANGFGRCVNDWRAEVREAKANAATECRAERQDPNFAAAHDGKTFQEHYGTNANGRNAFGKCVSQKAKAQVREEVEAEVEATENAAKACREEREADRDAFRDKYGTNNNKRNAFGKCVSQTAKAQAEAEAEGGEEQVA